MKALQKEYQIVKSLGTGSFGEVVLARSRSSRKEYAFKFYSLSQLTKTNKLYSVKRAMKIVQKLDSPLVVKLFEYIYDHQKLLLRFEACPYGSLESFTKRNPRRSHDLNRELICQIAEILEYLASKEVVHRDIKPANIVFGQDGCLKMIDFDQATTFNKDLIAEEEDIKIIRLKLSGGNQILRNNSIQIRELLNTHHSRSREQTFVGTPCYMPPEMKSDRIYDQKGDLWSFGCIAYELLMGKTYFCEEEDEAELEQHRKVERLSQVETVIGHDWFQQLNSILIKDPKNRPSIEDILDHPYLKEFRYNKDLRLRLRSEVVLKLRQAVNETEPSEDEVDDLKFSSFFNGFEMLSEIKVYAVVLKKGWFFYSPSILKSSHKSFDFYNQHETAIQDSVPFSSILSIVQQKRDVVILALGRCIRLKHTIFYMNNCLQEKMQYVFDSFK